MAKRILVIDDDEDILFILDIIFGDEGYERILYQRGTTVDEIKILHPDLILLDVRIAGYEKNGAEICAEIKTEMELSGIPVLLVSAEFNVDKLAQGCGADGYITKPFDIDGILEKVKKFLN
ncbi:MAG: response regulator [Bacteroidota bacterium]